MNRNREMMLQELMEVDFRMKDLQLYLDTHPECAAAVEEYNAAANKYMAMKQHFEKMYGPLTLSGKDDFTTPWQWVQSPWPWENTENKEGI